MCFSFFKARGPRVGDSLVEADEDSTPSRRALAAAARAAPASCCCRSTSWSRRRSRPAPSARCVDGDEVPDGWMGLDIGPAHGRGLRRADRRRPARSSGTARWARSSSTVRRRHPGGRRGGGRERRGDGGRRRRLGRAPCARFGLADRRHAPLHRRRRVARAARGQGAARRRGAPGPGVNDGEPTRAAAASPATGR